MRLLVGTDTPAPCVVPGFSVRDELEDLVDHGDIAIAHGQLQKAREFYKKGRQIAQRLQLRDSEASFLSLPRHWRWQSAGESRQAVEVVNSALALSPSFNVRILLAYDLAIAGENKKSLELASGVAHERADDSLMQAVYLPTTQALVALNSGDAQKAITLMKQALPYDKANTSAIYTRSLVYLKADKAAKLPLSSSGFSLSTMLRLRIH